MTDSDRKHAQRSDRCEDKLALLEKKLQVVWEEASDAMAFIDDEGILDCNQAARELFGLGESESWLGMPLHQLAPAQQSDGSDSRELIAREWGRAFEFGRSRFECLVKRVDGGLRVADISMTGIEMGGGHIVLAVFRDITRRWKREQARRMA